MKGVEAMNDQYIGGRWGSRGVVLSDVDRRVDETDNRSQEWARSDGYQLLQLDG